MSTKQTLFGLEVDALDMDEVLDLCDRSLAQRRPTLIGVVNAAKIVSARKDPALLDSLLECDVMLADGQSVVLASRFLGRPLPERVAGIDLFVRLLERADRDNLSVYLLGAKPDVLRMLVARIAEDYPNLTIAGYRDGYFTAQQEAEVAASIRRSGADMLFLGMTSPKKENFLRAWGPTLNVPILHGVGGSFDVLAGITKRAPEAWQRLGFEWLYRVLQEPRRLWKRYLTTNVAYAGLTMREMVRPTPAYAPKPHPLASPAVADIRESATSPQAERIIYLDRTPPEVVHLERKPDQAN